MHYIRFAVIYTYCSFFTVSPPPIISWAETGLYLSTQSMSLVLVGGGGGAVGAVLLLLLE